MTNLNIDSHKLMYHPELVAKWLNNEFISPIMVEVGVTNNCNHNCISCSLDWITHQKDYLDKTVLYNSFAEASKYNLKSVYICGNGEPLLHTDIEDIICDTQSLGIKVGLATNGQLLDNRLSEAILPFLSWIRISLDAAKAETHSKIHGVSEKCFPVIIDNISKAVSIKKRNNLNVNIGIQSLLLSENINEMEDIVLLSKLLEVDNVQIKPSHSHPKSKFKSSLYKFSFEGLQKELVKHKTDKFDVIVRSKTMEKINCRNYGKCHGMDFYSLIDANGDVVPCNLFYGKSKYIFGNIYNQSLVDIWKNPKRKKIIDNIAQEGFNRCEKYKCRFDVLNEYLWRIKNPESNDVFI